MSEAALELQNVSYIYDMSDLPVLQEINLTVLPGEWVAVVGASGSGKSTLGQLLSGYLPRAGGGRREGVLLVDGIDPAEALIKDVAKRIGLVLQDPDAGLVQGRVEDEVAFGPENLCYPVSLIEERVVTSLSAVELIDRRQDNVRALSGGQVQRTAIAAMLSLEPPILVFDEATASLDSEAKQRFLSLLRRLHSEGRTVVTLSGRMDEVAIAAPRLVVMDGGRIMMDDSSTGLISMERKRLIAVGVLPQLDRKFEQIEQLEQQVDVLAAGSYREQYGTSLLEVQDLSFTYDPGGRQVLTNVHLSLRSGEWRLLCGENGSGKTTLSRLLMGLISPPKGKVFWQGRDASILSLYDLAADIGYIFQQPEQQFVSTTVMEEMLYGPRCHLRLRPRDSVPEEIQNKARLMLAAIGLEEMENESPYLLSGGEKRLLSIAATFIVPKKLYILDEPTAGIDYNGAALLISMCREVVSSDASLIMITHEPELFSNENVGLWRMSNGSLQDDK